MYDTINFRLTAADVSGVSFIEEIPCHLTDLATHDFSGELVVTGTLHGLNVSVNRWQVKVKDGSMCKYYHGSNLHTMSLTDTHRAIERLSDELHLPMHLASVTRLDVGGNLTTLHPTDVYFNHLGVLAWSKRLLQPSGLYYCKRDEVLCFYNKTKELRAKGEPIPYQYQGKNILRYEQRYMGHLSRVLKVPPVKGATLYDEDFFNLVVSRWLTTYQAIKKINNTSINLDFMKNVRDLNRLGRLALIERAGGELALIEQVNEMRAKGELTSKQASDLKQAIRRAVSPKDGLVTPNEAIQELDLLIKECVDMQST